MPRKNKRARRNRYSTVSLGELCKKIGIQPKQRIIIIRYFKKYKGGV